MFDFCGRCAGFERAMYMRVHCTFGFARSRHTQLDQLARFLIQWAFFGRSRA